jgi:hypothetical protein
MSDCRCSLLLSSSRAMKPMPLWVHHQAYSGLACVVLKNKRERGRGAGREGVPDPHSRRLTRVVVRSKQCSARAWRLGMAGAGTPGPVSTAPPRQVPSRLGLGLGLATYFPAALSSPLSPWTWRRPCTCSTYWSWTRTCAPVPG